MTGPDRGSPRGPRARGLDDGEGRARRSQSSRSESDRRFTLRTTSSRATSRLRPGSPDRSSISGGTPTASSMPHVLCRWRGLPARESSFSCWSRLWAGCGACWGSWPRPAICWTAASRQRACWVTRMRWCGCSSAAPPRLSKRATWSLRSRPHRRPSTSAGISTRASTRPRQPWTWLVRSSRRGNRNVRSSCFLTPPEAEELVLISGGPRVHSLELLTRCWLALDRQDEAERAAVSAQARASALQFPMAVAWANRAAAAVDLQAGDPTGAADRALAAAAAAAESGAPIEAALSRTLAGRALAQAGERDRAVSELQTCSPGLRGLWGAALPRRGGTRTAKARPSHSPSHAAGQDRRDRHRVVDRTRASGRTACRRPQDESRDRHRALPQSKDGRDSPA